ncbi:MAG: hypothetical protein CMJ89_12820 [Planctomycetes bacterium]|jgi:hypothetical protein|nr:hypothetical protein [Planctomycetota bacterium]
MIRILLLTTVPTLLVGAVSANNNRRDHGTDLHFSHPIVTESPSPDTKLRFDIEFEDEADGDATSLILGSEYAFNPGFSIEVNVPYTFLDESGSPSESNFDNFEVALKFANYAYEDQGLLLGYGIEFGTPTGNNAEGIGSSNIFEIAPFMNFGYKREALEIVGFAEFGIPTNQNATDEFETELSIDFSSLYHFNDTWMGLFELDSEGALSGDESGSWIVNASPGFKVAPFRDKKLECGLSYGFSLSDREEFDSRLIFSLFWHL